jgi:hypothetical protein
VYKMTYIICIACVLKGELKALATKRFKNKNQPMYTFLEGSNLLLPLKQTSN